MALVLAQYVPLSGELTMPFHPRQTLIFRHKCAEKSRFLRPNCHNSRMADADTTYQHQVLSLTLEATSTTIGSPSSVPLSVSGPLYSTSFAFCSLYLALENIMEKVGILNLPSIYQCCCNEPRPQ